MSQACQARRNPSRTRCSRGARAGRGRRAVAGAAARVARARCRALLTAATVVSSRSATSRAGQPSTSRRISTARWVAGSSCSAATKASATLSRRSTIAAGSASVVGELVEQRVRVGLQPRHLGGGGERVTAPPVDHLEAGGGGDPVQPVPQRAGALVAAQAAPGPHGRLLHRLLRVGVGAEHPVAVHVQRPQVRRDQRPERVAVAGRGRRPAPARRRVSTLAGSRRCAYSPAHRNARV